MHERTLHPSHRTYRQLLRVLHLQRLPYTEHSDAWMPAATCTLPRVAPPSTNSLIFFNDPAAPNCTSKGLASRCRTIRSSVAIEVGSYWEHDTDAGKEFLGRAIQHAETEYGSFGQRTSGHRIAYNDKGPNGYCLQCVSDPRRASEPKRTCCFYAKAVCVNLGDPRVVRVVTCNLTHSPGCLWRSGEAGEAAGRRG